MERRDGAENWCAARVALASRLAMKHQDTERDFNHFLPGARSSLHPWKRKVRGFSTERCEQPVGRPGWASSWPALAARHSSPEDPSGAKGKEQGPRAGRDTCSAGDDGGHGGVFNTRQSNARLLFWET